MGDRGEVPDVLEAQITSLLEAGGRLVFVVDATGAIHRSNARAGAALATAEATGLAGLVTADATSLLRRVASTAQSARADVLREQTLVNRPGTTFSLYLSPFPTRDQTLVLVVVEPEERAVGEPSDGRHLANAIGDVTDRILHELRNFLLPLAGHTDLAMASVDKQSDAYHSLIDMQVACQKCEDTLRNLEAITRPPTSEPLPTYVDDVFDRATRLLRYAAPKGFRIETQVPPGLPMVRASVPAFQRTIVVLAAQGAPNRSPISVSILSAVELPAARAVLVEITVRGPGPRNQDSLVVEREQCRALALSLIQPQIEVDVETTPDEVRYRLTLQTIATSEERRIVGLTAGTESLLLHHSNPMMRDIARNYFRAKGYLIETVDSLTRATAVLGRETAFDAIVVDVEGRGDSLEALLDRAKARQAMRHVVVCVPTDFPRTELGPGTTVLRKPCSLDEIAAALRQALGLAP